MNNGYGGYQGGGSGGGYGGNQGPGGGGYGSPLHTGQQSASCWLYVLL